MHCHLIIRRSVGTANIVKNVCDDFIDAHLLLDYYLVLV